jgi:hypothetical protein
MLASACELIEYGCLPGVRVARKGDNDLGFHNFLSPDIFVIP